MIIKLQKGLSCVMKLKVIDNIENLTTIIQISDIEYYDNESEFRIWDMIGDMAVIKCSSVHAAEDCVRDLFRADRAELIGATIEWDNGDDDCQ